MEPGDDFPEIEFDDPEEEQRFAVDLRRGASRLRRVYRENNSGCLFVGIGLLGTITLLSILLF